MNGIVMEIDTEKYGREISSGTSKDDKFSFLEVNCKIDRRKPGNQDESQGIRQYW